MSLRTALYKMRSSQKRPEAERKRCKTPNPGPLQNAARVFSVSTKRGAYRKAKACPREGEGEHFARSRGQHGGILQRSPQGFSLIEVMIVLSIMGILLAVLYPNFSKVQDKAKATALQNVAYSLQVAIESYALNTGQYPQGDPLTVTQLVTQLKAQGELAQTPTNPFTNHVYTDSDVSGKISYSLDAATNQYTLLGYGQKNQVEVVKVQNL